MTVCWQEASQYLLSLFQQLGEVEDGQRNTMSQLFGGARETTAQAEPRQKDDKSLMSSRALLQCPQSLTPALCSNSPA